eukprot:38081-Rhodomonas_salina.1
MLPRRRAPYPSNRTLYDIITTNFRRRFMHRKRRREPLISLSIFFWFIAALWAGRRLVSAEWDLRDISQTEPFYECRTDQSRLNELTLTLRTAQTLESSTISISGLVGAIAPSSEVSINVKRGRDECNDFGGQYLDGSDKCFKVIEASRNFYNNAREACRSQLGTQANLASIQTREEDQLVRDMLKTAGSWGWIGYRRSENRNEQVWLWEDGQPVGYESWVISALRNNGTGYDCVAVLSDPLEPPEDNGWYKLPCGIRVPAFVCSKVMPSSPPMFCTSSGTVSKAAWQAEQDYNVLELTLCDGKQMAANTTYQIKFNVTNPQRPQSSPSVSIAVRGSDFIPWVTMEKSGMDLFGVRGAADPLFITAPPGYQSTTNDVCRLCPAGFWCPGGNVTNRCPEGSYGPEGQSEISACTCNAGFYGPDGGPCTQCPP